MWITKKSILLFWVSYLVLAVFTFGHAAANYQSNHVDAPLAGLCASIVWPLYWSWELQE